MNDNSVVDNSVVLDKLPQYYADNVEGASPFMPFIVAPVGKSQDTLVLGPQSVAEIHDEFINSLYGHIGSSKIEGMTARAFPFHSKMCVAVLLPTRVKDDGGRSGLIVTIGFFVKKRYIRVHSSILADYLNIFIETINRQFSLSLPARGRSRLMKAIEDAQGSSDQSKVSLFKLQGVMDSLLLASTTVGEISKKLPWWSKLPRVGLRQRLPKTIYYQPGTAHDDMLNIFLKELGQGLKGLGRTGVQQLFDRTDEDKGLMSLIPFIRTYRGC
jgi:hypothetical protein